MKLKAFPAALAAAPVVLACGSALAQQPAPAANPLDVAPERMPFDLPYGTPVALKRVVGAIGCSGGTGSQDEVAWRAGVAALR
jgi:uncharacterized protein GlcG (DUF336 family)